VIATNTQKIKALQKYFKKGDLSRSGEQLSLRCPTCNAADKTKKKLVVRLSDGWFHCWVCGISGKSYTSLFRKMFPSLLDDPELSFIVDRTTVNMQAVQEPKEEIVQLPEEIFLLGADDTQDPDVSKVREYLKSRGLTKGDMLRWRICATRQGPLRRKAIIPSFDADGNINYFVARTIDESPYKYNNAKRHRTEIVFNEIDVDWTKPVLLVEGVFDAIKCPENTIPALGSSLSKDSLLFKRLWENNCQVTVAFDPDLKEKSHKVCDLLSRAGLEVKQVWAPDGKDFGSLTKKEVLDVLKTSKYWTKESKLFFKIRNISSGSLL